MRSPSQHVSGQAYVNWRDQNRSDRQHPDYLGGQGNLESHPEAYQHFLNENLHQAQLFNGSAYNHNQYAAPFYGANGFPQYGVTALPPTADFPLTSPVPVQSHFNQSQFVSLPHSAASLNAWSPGQTYDHQYAQGHRLSPFAAAPTSPDDGPSSDEAFSWVEDSAFTHSNESTPTGSPTTSRGTGPLRSSARSDRSGRFDPCANNDAVRRRPEAKCDRCDVEFTRKSALRRHVKEQHEPVSYFACLDCRHHWRERVVIEQQDGGGGSCSKWKCSFCDELEPTSQHIMDAHPACVHSSNLTWFTRTGAWKKHCAEHTPEQGLTLDMCHVEEDEPPRLRVCDACGNVFESLEGYRKHVREVERRREANTPRGTGMAERSRFLTTSLRGLLKHAPVRAAFQAAAPEWFRAYSDEMTWNFCDGRAQTALQDLLHFDRRAAAGVHAAVFQKVMSCARRA